MRSPLQPARRWINDAEHGEGPRIVPSVRALHDRMLRHARRRERDPASVKRTTLLLALVLFGASPAQAMNCRDWGRLYENAKVPAVYGMIDAALAGSGGRSTGVNRTGIARCLERRAQEISYAFDDTCADSSRAGMQALNQLFKNYIWTCVR